MADVVIPGMQNQVALPEPPLHPLLTAGTLLLFEPSAPLYPWVRVPVPGDRVLNLAWREAAAIIGSGTEDTLSGGVSSSFVQGVGPGKDGLIELTAKGSLHFIPSQTYDVSGHLYSLLLPEPVRAWLNSHPSAEVYLGAALRITRKGGASALQNLIRLAASGSSVRQAIAELTNSVVSGSPTSGSTFVGRNFIPSPGEGVVAVTTTASTITNLIAGLVYAGSTTTSLHHAVAYILENVMIELPALSGRTHAQTLAAHQEYRAQMYKPGGALYGDTWRNQAEMP